MLSTFIFYASRVIEILFFTGAVGCVLAIMVSWIEIFSDGFTEH